MSKDDTELGLVTVTTPPDHIERVPTSDGVWGTLDADGPNYRGMGWIRTAAVLFSLQMGLGVLEIPAILAVFGMWPGLATLVAVGVLSTWCNYIAGQFKLAHPEVYSLGDVGQLLGGPILREFLDAGYWITMTLTGGAGMLGCSTALNALSDHSTCTALFVFAAAVIAFSISSIQTLDKLSWLTWVGSAGLVMAILTVTVAVGIQDRPSDAPPTGPWETGAVAVGSTSFAEASAALASVIFCWGAGAVCFNVVSEMKEPRNFAKSLMLCQILTLAFYMIVGGVVYHYCGQYVASPALGSAGPLLKKISYGLALPGLIINTVLNVHLPAKCLFVRILSGTEHLTANTRIHYLVWFGVVFLNTAFSFVFAESIPVFGIMLSLIGSALSLPFDFGLLGIMLIYEEWRSGHLRKRLGPVKIALNAFNAFTIIFTVFAMGAGLYGTVKVYEGGTTRPFSCHDNSNSGPKAP